jgi:hypothetical protein
MPRRVIALAGVSLEALRGFPDGFPRYRASPASLSAMVNTYLRENGLAETPAHTLYSLSATGSRTACWPPASTSGSGAI